MNLAALLDLAVVVLVEHFNRPIFELREDGHFAISALVPSLVRFPWTAAFSRLPFCYGCNGRRRTFFDVARLLDLLGLTLGGYCTFTLHKPEGLEAELGDFSRGLPFLPRMLHPVVLLKKRDHWLMRAFLPCSILLLD